MSHCENFLDGDKCEVSTDRHATDNPPTAIHSSSSKALVPYEGTIQISYFARFKRISQILEFYLSQFSLIFTEINIPWCIVTY